MLSDEAMLDRMKDGWRAGLPFTKCGNGSLPDATAVIRAWLPEVCDRHGIKSVCDAGAGDLKWRHGMEWKVRYRPFDLIPRHATVKQTDITRDALPKCDAILCRMVLNHLDEARVGMALDLFRQSAKYLIATQFDGPQPQRSPQFKRLDLRHWLGMPIESARDGREADCRLALWKF